jgi:hypothetical protein
MTMIYYTPSMDQGFGIAGLGRRNWDTLQQRGIPSRDQWLDCYSDYNPSLSREEIQFWKGFYLTFLFFKNCVIVHGVKQRAASGVASSAMAKKGKGT